MIRAKKITIMQIMHSIDCTNRIVVNFCKGMNRELFDTKVVGQGTVRTKEKDLSDIGIEYIVANSDIDVIVAAMKRWHIDVIHMHRSGHYDPLQYEIYRRAKEWNPNIIILETNFFGKFDPKSYPLIDCSLQVSKMMLHERYLKALGQFSPTDGSATGWDFHNTKILYHPIDCTGWDRIAIRDSEVREFKERLGIRDGDIVIGKLCRPAVEKWSDLLLDMLPYLVKYVPNVKMIVQEMPESRKKRIRYNRYKDHIILRKATIDDREVALFYKTIDIYVHSSKIGESFGMTLAEAGVFRKPVVINSTPRRDNNQLEMIEHMKTGIIANHPQTFARAVALLCRDQALRVRMGEAGRAKVARMYDPRRTAEQLEKIIVEKMAEKKLPIDPVVVEHYGKIDYFPTEAEIRAYPQEYTKRCAEEFSALTRIECCVNYLRIPKKMYLKIRDFLEHRFGM